ncbi:hypothetical protein [Fibrobacter sp. UWB7]|uniref:hypothetical protein n=1 Tax=Fibrobacter sp. UWB7 TaxID=1896206 RepID=UPI0009215B18|nr:hypothetical protein [Fibrobacter sp. UWB7]SHM70189.1 hypothetical protein SAMN05720467_2047 [Fibrobacter sp. UWB7]
MKFEIKRVILLLALFITSVITQSCALMDKSKYIEYAPRDRQLVLNGKVVSESKFGGVERWYAIDKYGGSSKVRFQVGYFRDEPYFGFVLYEGGTQGKIAVCYREGLDLRWDWIDKGTNVMMHSIVINKAGEKGYYYEFSSEGEKVLPRETFKVYKF